MSDANIAVFVPRTLSQPQAFLQRVGVEIVGCGLTLAHLSFQRMSVVTTCLGVGMDMEVATIGFGRSVPESCEEDEVYCMPANRSYFGCSHPSLTLFLGFSYFSQKGTGKKISGRSTSCEDNTKFPVSSPGCLLVVQQNHMMGAPVQCLSFYLQPLLLYDGSLGLRVHDAYRL